MPRSLPSACLILLLPALLSAQSLYKPDDAPKDDNGRVAILSVMGGLSQWQGVQLSGLYSASVMAEYYFYGNWSSEIGLSYWGGLADPLVSYDAGINFHLDRKASEDFYVGLTAIQTTYQGMDMVDVTIKVGVNFWLSEGFGFKAQVKWFLSDPDLRQLEAGLAFSF